MQISETALWGKDMEPSFSKHLKRSTDAWQPSAGANLILFVSLQLQISGRCGIFGMPSTVHKDTGQDLAICGYCMTKACRHAHLKKAEEDKFIAVVFNEETFGLQVLSELLPQLLLLICQNPWQEPAGGWGGGRW
eukprot:1159615-Pelagomonas_calceolata.AAC.3